MADLDAEDAGGVGDADLRAFTDDTRASIEAAERRRRTSLHQQATEEGTFAGILLDLAERTVPVAVGTTGGRTLRGAIAAIGRDVIALRAANGAVALVAIRALATVRAEPGSVPSIGDRVLDETTTLLGHLAGLAPDRPTVSIRTVTGETVAGTLRTVGLDVLVVRVESTASVYVAGAAISDVMLS